jgi:hypothetical protein
MSTTEEILKYCDTFKLKIIPRGQIPCDELIISCELLVSGGYSEEHCALARRVVGSITEQGNNPLSLRFETFGSCADVMHVGSSLGTQLSRLGVEARIYSLGDDHFALCNKERSSPQRRATFLHAQLMGYTDD